MQMDKNQPKAFFLKSGICRVHLAKPPISRHALSITIKMNHIKENAGECYVQTPQTN